MSKQYLKKDLEGQQTKAEWTEMNGQEKTEVSLEFSTDGKKVTQDLTKAVGDKQNWQQRFMTVIDIWRKKNPVIACILGAIILELIIQIFFTTFSFIVQAVASAIVRAEPNTSSLKIPRIQEAQNVLVIGELPYYYQIAFDDPDTQEHLRGYISKRSVKPVPDPLDNKDGQTLEPTKPESNP